MPRKKRETIDDKPDQNNRPVSFSPSASTPPSTLDEAGHGSSDQRVPVAAQETNARRVRSFKSVLSLPAKGATLGERNGHDWVISFPEDPGTKTKDKLRNAGFEYRDRKWKVFTHAANRPVVEALAKELKQQIGDAIVINDYPTRQVVLAFDAPPGDEITTRLKQADFHFRSDFTWNADYSPESQQFARDLIKTLPDQSRSASRGQ